MLKVGVIGYGYWGPNIVRNFMSLDEAKVVYVCDLLDDMLKKAKKVYPSVSITKNYEDICLAKDIDVVAIVTPVFTHYEMAKKALLNGKHVFVEKPFTYTVEQAEELIEIAEKRNLKIMVDHTFLFTGSVRKIKEIIDSGMLGRLFYFDSVRVNLGLFQHDVNVIWDLAPHDLSIMDYLISSKPTHVSATGAAHFNSELEDLAYMTFYFKDNMIAHFNVNWLSPVKVRTTMIGGNKKMLLWNDIEEDQKIKIYDKGVDVVSREGVYELLVNYRSGDIWVPKVDKTEALKVETTHFVDCVLNNKTPISDGEMGLRVVRMLAAANKSLSERGRLVEL
ncbi:MAG: Gfo/Idh/MocA family oxidoreductase [Syntrophorhabdaceae bacterium]|nr:Gfo/Idh/MocA family oxidoreductase [Syntrophorhabdaceae bacterium]